MCIIGVGIGEDEGPGGGGGYCLFEGRYPKHESMVSLVLRQYMRV